MVDVDESTADELMEQTGESCVACVDERERQDVWNTRLREALLALEPCEGCAGPKDPASTMLIVQLYDERQCASFW